MSVGYNRLSFDAPLAEIDVLTLISLSYSPWSEKALWALDHHRITYRKIEYLPMLGSAWLRAKMRRWRGRVTVPSMIDGEIRLGDSFLIARHADRIGGSSALFPEGKLVEIEQWNRLSQRGLEAGRALVTMNVTRSPKALEENLPPLFPRAMRPLFRPVAKMGAGYLTRKYGLKGQDTLQWENQLRGALEALRDGLEKSSPYLLGEFSFADITMAMLLHVVHPLEEPYLRLEPENRRCWSHPQFAKEFEELVLWRDELYRNHRNLQHR